MKHYYYLLVSLLVLSTACKKENNNGALPLAVKGFWPNSGNAGTIVHISGTGFGVTAAANEVLFNGAIAKVVDVRDTLLIVLAPAEGTTGNVSLKVGDKKIEVGKYTYQSLTISNISPANGPAGTNIFISGAGFSSLTAPAKVTVNGKDALVTGASDTLLVAAVPVAAGSGKVSVSVDGKSVDGPDFIFQAISSISPAKGGKGTQVTILGEGFSAALTDNHVTFNGKAATVASAAGGQLVVTAPDGVTTGMVAVSINGQTTNGGLFTVVPAPFIKTVTPLSGPVGATVTITGNYFSSIAAEISVSFNGKAAKIIAADDKELTVAVPMGAGIGTINIIVNGQQTTGPVFTEQNLGIAKLFPANGLDGTPVTITGMGFSTIAAQNTVTFNGVPATVISATETTLTLTAPAGLTTGPVVVKVGGLQAVGPVFSRAGVITMAGGPNKDDFNFIKGIAVDSRGNIFVTDGNLIKKVTPAGNVSIYAGSTTTGNIDGPGSAATFNFPTALVMDDNDNLLVCDRLNSRIRKITPAGKVSTLAVLSFTPIGLAIGPNGSLYVGAQYEGVYQLETTGVYTRLSNRAIESAAYIVGGGAGIVYYAHDTYDYNSVFTIKDGAKSIYTGFNAGFADGTLQSAGFSQPIGLAIDAAGIMYTTDQGAIRTIADGKVTTIIGTKGGTQPIRGYADGAFNKALFQDVTYICLDKEGNLYVAERDNKAIRKIFFK